MKTKSLLRALALLLKPKSGLMRGCKMPVQKIAIEPLESRISPATLISATMVTFLDADGDTVTLTASKPLFHANTINKVLKFDTATVNGSNSAAQQLQLIDFTRVRASTVAHTALTIDAVGGDGYAKIGFINAGRIDLGAVTVDGDLGRIFAGDTKISTPGLASLTVHSLGKFGTATQKGGGDLFSRIQGALGSLSIGADVSEASIGVGGGANGTIGDLDIGGSILGGKLAFSGSVRASGNVGNVHIGGDVMGGGGEQSGIIGTSGTLGSVQIEGSITGGGGAFSGAILSTGDMGAVTIGKSVSGGAGVSSGHVGTAGKIASVKLDGSLVGGQGESSGTILSTGDMGGVHVGGDVKGGGGRNSGRIGGAGTMGASFRPASLLQIVDLSGVTIDGSLIGGAGDGSGTILSTGEMGAVKIAGDVKGGEGTASGQVATSAALASFTLDGSLIGGVGGFSGSVTSGGDMGPVKIAGDIKGGTGANSGHVGSSGNLDSLALTGDLLGGDGGSSGTVLSDGNLGSVTIGKTLIRLLASVGGGGTTGGNITGGMGDDSGTIRTFSSLGETLVNGDVTGGVGTASGGIFANGFFGEQITIDGDLRGGEGFQSGQLFLSGVGGVAIVITGDLAGGGGFQSGLVSVSGDVSSLLIDGYLLSGEGPESGHVLVSGRLSDLTVDQSIDGGTVVAGSIGLLDVLGGGFEEQSASIANAKVRATNGSINMIVVQSFGVGISHSAFDALEDIGPIKVQGGIDQSLFVAGVDLGGNFAASLTSAGTFDNTSAADFGFGGGDDVVTLNVPTIGGVKLSESELSAPNITNTTFVSGIYGAGSDGNFGTLDDATVAGSDTGDFGPSSAIGNLENVFVASGEIGATHSFGHLSDTKYLATSASGSGIGDIQVNTSVDSTHPNAIAGSTFTSAADLGDISATISGETADEGLNGAIINSSFLAGHAIGTLTATNDTTGDGTAGAIVNSHLAAGRTPGSAGGIGGIEAKITNFSGFSAAIMGSDFDASAGPGSSGNIGKISATNIDFGQLAISSSTFRAHGNIGDISASASEGEGTANAIDHTVFSAFGSIGKISVDGNVTGDSGPSRFLAGYDIGSDLTFGNENLGEGTSDLQPGQHVGDVAVSGNLIGSDIIASVVPGTAGVFGGANDANYGAGGSIGSLNIGFNFEGVPHLIDGDATHAIEAKIIGNNPSFIPFLLDNGGSPADVRVTLLPHAAIV